MTAVIIGVIILALIVAVIGLVIIIDVQNDDDKGTGNSNNNPSPTPSPSLLVSPSASASANATMPANNQDQDINQKYYKAAEAHPFTVDDLVRTDRISEPVASPDEQLVAFSRYVYKLVFDWFYTLHDTNY